MSGFLNYLWQSLDDAFQGYCDLVFSRMLLVGNLNRVTTKAHLQCAAGRMALRGSSSPQTSTLVAQRKRGDVHPICISNCLNPINIDGIDVANDFSKETDSLGYIE